MFCTVWNDEVSKWRGSAAEDASMVKTSLGAADELRANVLIIYFIRQLWECKRGRAGLER